MTDPIWAIVVIIINITIIVVILLHFLLQQSEQCTRIADCGLRVIAAIWYCGWECKQSEGGRGRDKGSGREGGSGSKGGGEPLRVSWRLAGLAFGHDTLMQSQLKSQTHWQWHTKMATTTITTTTVTTTNITIEPQSNCIEAPHRKNYSGNS